MAQGPKGSRQLGFRTEMTPSHLSHEEFARPGLRAPLSNFRLGAERSERSKVARQPEPWNQTEAGNGRDGYKPIYVLNKCV